MGRAGTARAGVGMTLNGVPTAFKNLKANVRIVQSSFIEGRVLYAYADVNNAAAEIVDVKGCSFRLAAFNDEATTLAALRIGMCECGYECECD